MRYLTRVGWALLCGVFNNDLIWSFLTLKAALAQPHGTQVCVIAVVAYVGPTEFKGFKPFYTREIRLKDTRLVLIHTVYTFYAYMLYNITCNIVVTHFLHVAA
jgi:hypothetical protein